MQTRRNKKRSNSKQRKGDARKNKDQSRSKDKASKKKVIRRSKSRSRDSRSSSERVSPTAARGPKRILNAKPFVPLGINVKLSKQTDQYLTDDLIQPLPIQHSTASSVDPISSITLTTKPSQSLIRLSSSPQQIPLVLTIKSPSSSSPLTTSQLPTSRLGVDIVCVFDVSGSMSGAKITLLKKSLKYIIEILNENDRLCLIRFNDFGERLCSLTKMTAENKKHLQKIVQGLQASGGTSILSGLNLAFQTLAQKKHKNNIESIFFFSDGLDPFSKSSLQPLYYDHLQKLSSTAPNFTLHSFGYGEDHDSDLMIQISNLRDGSFFYISNFEILQESLALAMAGLFSVAAAEVKIKVRVEEGWKVRAMGELAVWDEGEGVWKIGVRGFLEESVKNFVFVLEVPAEETGVELKDINRHKKILDAEALLSPVFGSSTAPITLHSSLFLSFYSSTEPPLDIDFDNEVLEQFWRLKSIQEWNSAELLIKQGNIEQAINRTEIYQTQLCELPMYKTSKTLNVLHEDMERIKGKLREGKRDRAEKMVKYKKQRREREEADEEAEDDDEEGFHLNKRQKVMLKEVKRKRGYQAYNDKE